MTRDREPLTWSTVNWGVVWISLFTLLFWTLVGRAIAQTTPVPVQPAQPQFQISVDTLGIEAVDENIYLTWIFAQESPKHHPVSAILVAFDCERGMVARIAHIVYTLQPDGQITGPIEEDPGTWVPFTNQKMFHLVCTIGPTHGTFEEETQAPKVEDFYRDQPKLQRDRDDWRDV